MAKSSSSSGHLAATLISGATSAAPHLVASFRVGDNSADPDGQHEYLLADGEGEQARTLARGHLTWDPAYAGTSSPFFSVAPVYLDVMPGEVRWSVGTADFIPGLCKPYHRIEKIQVLALTGKDVPEGLVQWESIKVTFHYADGRHESYNSPCLPRASMAQSFRRPAGAPRSQTDTGRQQYAQISANGADVRRVQIRGQVTLRANDGGQATAALRPDDLQGKILVFTDAARGEDGVARQ